MKVPAAKLAEIDATTASPPVTATTLYQASRFNAFSHSSIVVSNAGNHGAFAACPAFSNTNRNLCRSPMHAVCAISPRNTSGTPGGDASAPALLQSTATSTKLRRARLWRLVRRREGTKVICSQLQSDLSTGGAGHRALRFMLATVAAVSLSRFDLDQRVLMRPLC